MARMFENGSIDLHERHFTLPGLSPRLRIINGELILELIFGEPSESLRDFQLVAGARERSRKDLGVVIGGFHNKCIAFPAADRIAQPGLHCRWRVLCIVDRNHANFMLVLNEDHDGVLALHNLKCRVVAGRHHDRPGAVCPDTARPDGDVLDLVIRGIATATTGGCSTTASSSSSPGTAPGAATSGSSCSASRRCTTAARSATATCTTATTSGSRRSRADARRQLTVWRVDDNRGAQIGRQACLTPIQCKLSEVVMDVGRSARLCLL